MDYLAIALDLAIFFRRGEGGGGGSEIIGVWPGVHSVAFLHIYQLVVDTIKQSSLYLMVCKHHKLILSAWWSDMARKG